MTPNYAQCQPTGQCVPGVHQEDHIQTPWTCNVIASPVTTPEPVTTSEVTTSTSEPAPRGGGGGRSSPGNGGGGSIASPVTTPEPVTTSEVTTSTSEPAPRGGGGGGSPPGNGGGGGSCPASWQPCQLASCCADSGHTCYEKDDDYAQCLPTGSCLAGGWPRSDPKPSPWRCHARSGGGQRPPPPCEDGHSSCPTWSQAGECQKNPRYMKMRCMRSCGMC